MSSRQYFVEFYTGEPTLDRFTKSMGLIMCSKKKILAVESRDLSEAEKEVTACKVEQIFKMTPIFTQNDNQGLF